MKVTQLVTMFAFAASLLFAGCGGPTTVPVSGKVTAAGKPMAGIHVCFQPRSKGSESGAAGPASVGTTDAEGRFTLSTIEPVLQGAVPGDHIVIISMNQKDEAPQDDSGAYDPSAKYLPSKAYDGSVQFTVPDEGTDAADFELTKL